MKKLLLSSLAVVALSLASLSASAATLPASGFTVKVTLTPLCKIVSTTASHVLDFGSYTAFQIASPAPTFQFQLNCTRGFSSAPTLTFDTSGGGTDGVIAGLNYSLSYLNDGTTASGGTTASPGTAGSAAIYDFTVKGTMPGGQAGYSTTSAPGLVQDITRTIVVTY